MRFKFKIILTFAEKGHWYQLFIDQSYHFIALCDFVWLKNNFTYIHDPQKIEQHGNKNPKKWNENKTDPPHNVIIELASNLLINSTQTAFD